MDRFPAASLYDRADKASLDAARDILIQRLYDGGTVKRCSIRDIFDCALNNAYTDVRYQACLDILTAAADMGCGDERISRVYDIELKCRHLIESFVDSNPDLIEEEAATMEREEC